MMDDGVVTTPGDRAALRDELARLTLELCRIPSETGHEAAIADFVEATCVRAAGEGAVRRIGNAVVCDPGASGAAGAPPASRVRDPASAPGAASAPDASRPARDALPTVALVGHLDTVRCAADQPTEIRDGRVYGCGASDMKGGLAVMLALLERRSQLTAARPVWIFYDREEGPYEENGLEPVFQSGVLPPIDLAFVLEPTDYTVQMGCMGALHARVTVAGRRAHSARPWQGENAVYRALPLLGRFAALERQEVRFGPLTFYEVAVVTQAWTENSRNVVPDRLLLNVNVRFAPGRDARDVVAGLEALVGDDGTVEVTDVAPPGDVFLDHPLLQPWRARRGLEIAPKQAWTDVARFTARGVPAVNFGPGASAQAHQAGEWCPVDGLEFVFGHLWDFFTVPLGVGAPGGDGPGRRADAGRGGATEPDAATGPAPEARRP